MLIKKSCRRYASWVAKMVNKQTNPFFRAVGTQESRQFSSYVPTARERGDLSFL